LAPLSRQNRTELKEIGFEEEKFHARKFKLTVRESRYQDSVVQTWSDSFDQFHLGIMRGISSHCIG